MRLLAETKIETGLRWGELTELRVRDIDFPTRMLTVSRAVVEVNAKFHPAGGRFLVKDYPKDGEYRRLKLTSQIAGKLRAYTGERGLAGDDLQFAMPERGPRLTMLPNPDRLGRTGPNAAGRAYRHGTLALSSLVAQRSTAKIRPPQVSRASDRASAGPQTLADLLPLSPDGCSVPSALAFSAEPPAPRPASRPARHGASNGHQHPHRSPAREAHDPAHTATTATSRTKTRRVATQARPAHGITDYLRSPNAFCAPTWIRRGFPQPACGN